MALEVPIALPDRRRADPVIGALDHRQRAPGARAVERAGQRTSIRRRRDRRLGAGVAPRHAAGQRSRHRPEGQGPLQRQRAEGRRPVRRLRDQPDAAGAARSAVRRGRRQGADELPAHRPRRRVPDRRRTASTSRPTSTPAEMLRLNTTIAGDRSGRRRTASACSAATTPASRTAAGRATMWSTSNCAWRWACCARSTHRRCSAAGRPMRRPAAIHYTDGAYLDSASFATEFPYLRDPLPGSPNDANGVPAEPMIAKPVLGVPGAGGGAVGRSRSAAAPFRPAQRLTSCVDDLARRALERLRAATSTSSIGEAPHAAAPAAVARLALAHDRARRAPKAIRASSGARRPCCAGGTSRRRAAGRTRAAGHDRSVAASVRPFVAEAGRRAASWTSRMPRRC